LSFIFIYKVNIRYRFPSHIEKLPYSVT
jgi:hypothetical protein